MKIGLVRHFKVNHPFPAKKMLSKAAVIEWFEQYDQTGEIQYKNVDLHGINWKRCYSSDMTRAVNTAEHFYTGEIVKTADLRELDILHRLSGRIKLPFLVWGLVVRIKSFASNKDTDAFKNRIVAFVDKIMAEEKTETIVVSHWFVMRVIRKELIKRGFKGEKFRSNEYGTLYVYESADR